MHHSSAVPGPRPRGGATNTDHSLVHGVAASGRLTVGALSLVALTLLALFAGHHAIFGPAMQRSLETHTVTRLAHEAMLDQQVGLRGFLATGDERFLDAYRRGAEALPAANARATSLVGGDDRLGGLLLEVRLAQQAWIDEWAGEALRRGQAGGSTQTSFVQRDKVLFDEYRGAFDVLIAEVLARRDEAVRAEQRAVVAAIMLALVVTATAALFGLRRTRRLRNDVGAPLTALLHRLEQIRSGDLTTRVVPQGPSEFRALGAGLEQAASALAAAQSSSRQHASLLADRGRRQAEVLALAREVSGSLNLRYVLRGVSKHASAIADDARVVVWIVDDDPSQLVARADSAEAHLESIDLGPIAVGEDLVGLACKYPGVRREADPDSPGAQRIAVPMVVGAKVVGVLEFLGPEVHDIPADAVSVLETMAIHAATAIEAARLHEHTSEMAMTDALTGLRNRRRLNSDLREECTVSVRYGRPLAYLMIDIDHFKSYNDVFGHQAGDVALQAVAHTVDQSLRSSDHAYRYGGEEFALVLRETTTQDAMVFAERLRRMVEHRFSAPNELRAVTISIGVAEMSSSISSPNDLVGAADKALYAAKQAGRNRVKLASQLSHGGGVLLHSADGSHGDSVNRRTTSNSAAGPASVELSIRSSATS